MGSNRMGLAEYALIAAIVVIFVIILILFFGDSDWSQLWPH